jgi:hypothetical protein
LPEIESAGRAKHTLDVLIWLEQLDVKHISILGEVCILKEYLGSLIPYVCDIRFLVPETFDTTAINLARFNIPFSAVPVAPVTDGERRALGADAPAGLLQASATAISCDCDLILIQEENWFPYWYELDKYNLLAVDGDVLKRQCEIFVRGHDLPWAFVDMVWNYPWTTFYMMVEFPTFKAGLAFLEACQKKNIGQDAFETGRMLVYNRFPNLCFTRDRLLFYEMQRRAAKRLGWTRQNFQFEVGYSLEYYYLLIFGGLDSVAVLVNYALKLGVKLTRVAAQSQVFLEALSRNAPEIHAAFVDPQFSDFLERVASLRHLAAHRGSIMPGQLYEKPDVEPTLEELDRDIREQGIDTRIEMFPPGPLRDWARDCERYRMRLEKSKKILDEVLPVKIKGKYGFIHPMSDTEWNFYKCHNFMAKVLEARLNRL